MSIKFRAIIVAILLLLSTLIIGWNFGFVATNPAIGSNQGSEPRSNGDFDWDSINVISEPVPGQNFALSTSMHAEVAVEGNKIYVVWMDENITNGAGPDSDIFYRHFDGNNWSEIQVISEPVPGQDINTQVSMDPSIAVENGKVYIVWTDYNNTNGAGLDRDIFYRCNITGSSWEAVQVISEPVLGQNFNTGWSSIPAIAVENDIIYVVWEDDNNTNNSGIDRDIFYKCNLTGSSWEPTQVISEPVLGKNINTVSSGSPAIAVENDNIYVVWDDFNNTNGAGGDDDIFYRANLTGSSWEPVQVISEPVAGSNINTAVSWYPDIAVENSKIYVVWEDNNNTNGAGLDWDIFYRCNLTGTSWEDIQVISEPIVGQNFNTGDSLYPDLAVENGKIYVVWFDWNNTNGAGTEWDIFYRGNFTGSSWEPIQVISEPVPGQNFNTGVSMYPDTDVGNGNIHVVWHDSNNTNGSGSDYDIFYRWKPSKLTLLFPKVTPISGNTSTYFNFTVRYTHIKNTAPTQITVNISEIEYPLLEVEPTDNNYGDGKDYFLNITHLDIGVHSYRFYASDGLFNMWTTLMNNPIVTNTPPNITTQANLTALEDELYEINYEYDDIDVGNIGQIVTWNFSTNATWLAFDNITAKLNGTPTQNDIGQYWINISINDTMEIDFTNFTITVIEVNDNPVIITTDIEITYEDAVYFIDYNATDMDSPLEDQIWYLSSNVGSWLSINSSTGILNGTPTNDDVSDYWVNVSVSDSENGTDFTNFTLTVLDVNDPPIITTIEETTVARIGKIYEVDYNATDIDTPLSLLKWYLNTNATWITYSPSTGIITGTPTIENIGWFNVNLTVDDGEGGQDWHEFILKVPSVITNEPPVIITADKVSALVDELYVVYYEATDDYTPVDELQWFLETNAFWLDINLNSGILVGTPTIDDIGTYWVNVSVFDGEDGWDYHNFTLTVTKEPIAGNIAPELSKPKIIPTEGDINTEFRFLIHYYDADGDLPVSIEIVIDGVAYKMELKLEENASNGIYEYSLKLSKGIHTYYFTASDGIDTVTTDSFRTPFISDEVVVEDDEDDEDKESGDWIVGLVIIIIIVIITIILIIAFLMIRKKKEEKKPEEELPPPPPEEEPPEKEPPEIPPEQPSPEETPPEKEPPEIPPEQPPLAKPVIRPTAAPPPAVTPQAAQPLPESKLEEKEE